MSTTLSSIYTKPAFSIPKQIRMLKGFHNTFVQDFKDLLKTHPDVDIMAMGFSANWITEPLWQ